MAANASGNWSGHTWPPFGILAPNAEGYCRNARSEIRP